MDGLTDLNLEYFYVKQCHKGKFGSVDVNIYLRGSNAVPEYPGFRPIICLTKSTAWGDLGPYVLKNENGQIMENIWQFSKVYQQVPKVRQREHGYSDNYWIHPAEVHVKNGRLTPRVCSLEEKRDVK